MNNLSNYPPGVTGNEPEINGMDDADEKLCWECKLVDENGNCDPNRPDCPITVRDFSQTGE